MEERAKLWLTAAFAALLGAGVALFIIAGVHQTDFMVLWAGPRAEHPYVASEIRKLIATAMGREPGGGASPYAYPPTLLLITEPLRLVPWTVGLPIWTASGCALFALAVRHPLAPAFLASPWAAWAILTGQTSLIVGALILLGLRAKRQVACGALLALAICIKPHLVVFVPFGLALAGRWRALFAMSVASAALCAASILLYGLNIWRDWIVSLSAFQIVAAHIGWQLNLPGLAWRIGALAVGAPLLYRAYRRGASTDQALAAGGLAIVCAPHALWYDAAIIAPAAARLVLSWRWRSAPAALLLVLQPTPWMVATMGGLALFGPLRERPPDLRGKPEAEGILQQSVA